MTDEENPMTTDGGDGTRHVRMPVPPGGDADRHPGSPDLGDPDPGADADDPATSSGHPHSGRRHRVDGDEGLPGESAREERTVSPPGER